MDNYSLQPAKTINSIRIFLFINFALGIIGTYSTLDRTQSTFMIIGAAIYGISAGVQAFYSKRLGSKPFTLCYVMCS